MARQAKQQPAEDLTANIDAEALQETSDKADLIRAHLAHIDATFGDGLPFDQRRLESETRFYLNQSAEAMLEAGKRLIVLKEHLPHGDFTESLEHIGLAPRAARKMMQAAIKFSGPRGGLAESLSKTKLIELISEDDEELEALAEGGTIAGLTLDEIESMSAAQLRQALREERQKRADDQEIHDRLLASKNKKLDDLNKKLSNQRRRVRPWAQRVKDIQVEITVHAAAALEALDLLDKMRDVILTEEFDDDEREAALEAMAIVYYDGVAQVTDRTAEVRHACDECFGGYKDKAVPLIAELN